VKSKENWSADLLSNLSISIDYGHTASATLENTETKCLRITDIQDGFVNWETVPFCECSERESKRYELANGDIVFARTGATTGKSYLIDDCPPKSVFASYLIRVRPNNRINPKYLFHYFQTSDYWKQISSRSTGTAQAGVNASKLASFQIPLPPLPEQKRIAEVLDKADALREKRHLALQKLDTLLQSVFLEMFGDPVKNPKGLPKTKISEISTRITKGESPNWQGFGYEDSGIRFVTSENVG
jgi:type I restriction enzyme S subunit